METVIANRIRKHYKDTNFFSPFQHGFRQNEGVDELLTLLRLKWAKLILRKNQPKLPKNVEPAVHAIFLDIRKAFDKVWHSGLLYKLYKSGITGETFHWIHNFLKSRRQVVVVEGKESTPKYVQAGVPQGSVLGPLLFLVYINDMDSGLKSPHHYFADDTQLSQHGTAEGTQIYKLNTDLNHILQWSKKWKVQFAPEKTIHIRIAKNKPPDNKSYQTYGTKSQIIFNHVPIQRSKSQSVRSNI